MRMTWSDARLLSIRKVATIVAFLTIIAVFLVARLDVKPTASLVLGFLIGVLGDWHITRHYVYKGSLTIKLTRPQSDWLPEGYRAADQQDALGTIAKSGIAADRLEVYRLDISNGGEADICTGIPVEETKASPPAPRVDMDNFRFVNCRTLEETRGVSSIPCFWLLYGAKARLKIFIRWAKGKSTTTIYLYGYRPDSKGPALPAGYRGCVPDCRIAFAGLLRGRETQEYVPPEDVRSPRW